MKIQGNEGKGKIISKFSFGVKRLINDYQGIERPQNNHGLLKSSQRYGIFPKIKLKNKNVDKKKEEKKDSNLPIINNIPKQKPEIKETKKETDIGKIKKLEKDRIKSFARSFYKNNKFKFENNKQKQDFIINNNAATKAADLYEEYMFNFKELEDICKSRKKHIPLTKEQHKTVKKYQLITSKKIDNHKNINKYSKNFLPNINKNGASFNLKGLIGEYKGL